MKGNNGKGNVIERDDWETPQWLFDKLHKQYKFNIDCCASSQNTKIMAPLCFFSKERPFNRYMGKFIIENCWMNPPFSKAELMFIHFFNVSYRGVAIYRSDNLETKLWQDIILKKADWIFFFRGRINYEGMKGKGSRFPSALIGIGVPLLKNWMV